jgi:selenocysteine-specific elongation factor
VKSVIVGTAGHIDHGKTALVKALTGIDADRLEEEKRRGITIDIGFAHLEIPTANGGPLRLGFVDVPGHERFVRNMLAGIGGIDLVLLVVAADESVKPQTREHFDICRMLNVRRGIVVLTKADLADQDMLEITRAEVQDLVRDSFLADAPVVSVSSLTGAGLDELKEELARLAVEIPARDSSALFRLPIDRVFTMKGFGTVVTGTLISGSVAKDDDVQVFPSDRRVRVRGVQVHGSTAERAIAGQRTAVNLAGVELNDLARGMSLAAPGVLQSTMRADVSLQLLPSAKALRDRARVHFHCYTTECVAEVALDAKQVEPGQAAYARLRFVEPILLLPGDRFIVRQFSPVVTIGGGIVIDAAPLRQKQAVAERVAALQALQNVSRSEVLFARIARRGSMGLPLAEAVAETGWTPRDITAHVNELSGAKRIVHVGELLVSATAFAQTNTQVLRALETFHAANPLATGIGREQLREQLSLAPELLAGVLDQLARDKRVEVAGEQVRLAGRGVSMKSEEAESMNRIEQAFASAGLKVPALKEVLAALPVDRTRAQKIVTLLLRDRVLVKLSDDLVFHRAALDDLRQRVQQHKGKSPKIDVAAFKDLTGVSRKYAIPLLEYLDRERVTRRAGDERIIL